MRNSMILSMDMITSTARYYCGCSHQYKFKNLKTMIWIWRGGRKSKIVFHIIRYYVSDQIPCMEVIAYKYGFRIIGPKFLNSY